MDFNTLLNTAQRNGKSDKKQPIRCYNTKFEPPKKEQRSKQLSVNIQKFLARKEAEEKIKQEEANKKREALLSLRAQDKKATRRVNVMLKRTKSANQSAIVDAIDKDNTSVTLAGPAQPDEDDYGYVSQEAAAYYNKLMEKYNKIPDEPKFNIKKNKPINTNLSNTKDRVKAAIEREKEEANMPHKRKRKIKMTLDNDNQNQNEVNLTIPIKKSKPTAPPPINFSDLLKIAEKKQFEPIVIEQKPKEEEKLLTKKQKKELEREREWREKREATANIAPENKLHTKFNKPNNNNINNKITNLSINLNEKHSVNEGEKRNNINKLISDRKLSSDKTENRNNVPSKNLSSKPIISNSKATSYLVKNSRNQDSKRQDSPSNNNCSKDLQIKTNSLKNNNSNNTSKRKEFSSKDLMKSQQFPLTDLRRVPTFVTKNKTISKRRILDDDGDSECDSEMDDFIDDGPDDEKEYSKEIQKIFGYDKSKYRNIDEDVDNMESSFAQQMREEVISSKIGRMEDLEDMKKEEEEKQRKMLRKKKLNL